MAEPKALVGNGDCPIEVDVEVGRRYGSARVEGDVADRDKEFPLPIPMTAAPKPGGFAGKVGVERSPSSSHSVSPGLY